MRYAKEDFVPEFAAVMINAEMAAFVLTECAKKVASHHLNANRTKFVLTINAKIHANKIIRVEIAPNVRP
jgi:hypothetical protein